MITYTWKINELTVMPTISGLQDVVKAVRYTVVAMEDGLSTSITLSVELNSVSDPNTFISYKDLSENTVIGWVQSMTDMVQLEARAQIELGVLRDPAPVNKPLPWK